jgi:molecular chaperone IbpA
LGNGGIEKFQLTQPLALLTARTWFLNRKIADAPRGSAKQEHSPLLTRIHVAHAEDVAMRTNLNFSPLFRSTIGFDRVFDLLENANRVQNFDDWPPYDIVHTSEDAYRITMAVAGFGESELTLTHGPNLLVVSGQNSAQVTGEYLHRGIPDQAFERRFELADHVKVVSAKLENGLLTIELAREVPEEMKPRRIQIRAGQSEPRSQIGSQKEAA